MLGSFGIVPDVFLLFTLNTSDHRVKYGPKPFKEFLNKVLSLSAHNTYTYESFTMPQDENFTDLCFINSINNKTSENVKNILENRTMVSQY